MLERADFRILVMDDDELHIEVTQALLGASYNVQSTQDSPHGVALAADFKPHLILIDVNMPVQDGFASVKLMKERGIAEQARVIFISATTTVDERLNAYGLGADDFILKPFNHQELRAKVEIFYQLVRMQVDLQQRNEMLNQAVREQVDSLYLQSIMDATTGLGNRNKLYQDLGAYFSGEGKELQPTNLLVINICDFRRINVAYGMEIGDAVIREVSEIIKGLATLAGQKLYRSATDEFTIIDFSEGMTGENLADPYLMVLTVGALELAHGDKHIYVNVNVNMGHLVLGSGETSVDRALQNLTIALDMARKKGKDRCETYHEEWNHEQRYQENIFWSGKVAAAIANKGFLPYFQPIRCNTSKSINKFECLVRMLDNGNVIGPAKFLGSAEDSSRMVEIRRILFDQGLALFSRLPQEISFNLHEQDLTDPGLVRSLMFTCNKHKVDPRRITLELLESIDTESGNQFVQCINELKANGFRIALDDFGVHYSNFHKLFIIKPDFIKIDGTFIKNLDTDETSYKITSMITLLALDLGSQVVAEFVHSESVQKKIEELGIQFSQGYLFGAPMPFAELTAATPVGLT